MIDIRGEPGTEALSAMLVFCTADAIIAEVRRLEAEMYPEPGATDG